MPDPRHPIHLYRIPPQEVASTARVAHENHTLHMELNLQKHANSNLMQQLNDSQLALAMKEQELEVCVAGVVAGRGHAGQGVPVRILARHCTRCRTTFSPLLCG